MRRFALLALLAPFANTAAPQEESPSPAQELAAFEPFLGHWTGSGTVRNTADAEPKPWTAEANIQRILGGHCVREDLSVDLGEMLPGRLAMSALYGFDPERGRIASYAVSNLEPIVAEPYVHFDGTGALVTFAMAKDRAGTPTMERSVLRVEGDGWTLRIEHSVGAAPLFTHVEGSFARAPADAAPMAPDVGAAAASLVPVPSELAALAPLVGAWRIEGEMTMTPGAEPVHVSGTETYAPAFGGQILASRIVGGEGAEGGYEGLGFTGWEPDEQCYRFAWADSMGMIGTSEARWAGAGRLVFTHSRPVMGQPNVERAVLELGEGGPTEFRSDRLLGVNAADGAFEATYTRAK